MKNRPAFDAGEVFFLVKPAARAALPIPTLRGSDWAKEGAKSLRSAHHPSTKLGWWMQCQMQGMETLAEHVEIDPEKRSGLPVLCGTRFTVAQVLAELAETHGVEEVADAFDLNADAIRGVLNGMSLVMQRPLVKR